MDMSICYIIVVVVTVALMIWGFMDILKNKQPNEADTHEVISRQLKGFGFLVLAQVALFVGMLICFGVSGGMEKAFKKVGDMMAF